MPKKERDLGGFPWIGAPAKGALEHEGYYKLEDLVTLTEKQLLAIHGVGPKAVGILKEALAEKGLSLAPPAPRK